MKIVKSIVFSCFFMAAIAMHGQTIIPNASFENWTSFGNFSDPTGWDTPNTELMSIPFFGITVVSKSTDHHGTGSFSAKLETRHMTLPPLDVPGFITCGNLVIDINAGTYLLSGGVPVVDLPTHLKGFYKYFPLGGDSCAIGIGLTKTTGAITDTIGYGAFSTKETIPDWTPFSAWIDYLSTVIPDTMNIVAMSTAQEVMTIGTTLYVDDLYLDYTVGYDKQNPSAGINIYNDLETKRLMLFFDFVQPEITTIRLFNMIGQEVSAISAGVIKNGKEVISYQDLRRGIYILEILHGNTVLTKKFFLNQ
jgi:hypothetical protein